MPLTDAQKRANAKYRREHVTQKIVAFYPAEADLLAHVKTQGAFATYVKRLIREDMEHKQ